MTDTEDDPHYFTINSAEIIINDEAWLNHGDLKSSISKVINDEEMSIMLTNDNHIQQLNNDFRNKDKPTNVLSFPADEDSYLGDIAISLETIEKEALEQEKDFYHHFIHMLVHGILHLKGYDHLTDEEAEEMETIEIKILADMGIKNPYI